MLNKILSYPNGWKLYCETLSDHCFFVFLISDRGEVQKGSAEIFFRKVKFWEDGDLQEAPPVFVGIIFLSSRAYNNVLQA